jgi:hypothetical protein
METTPNDGNQGRNTARDRARAVSGISRPCRTSHTREFTRTNAQSVSQPHFPVVRSILYAV